MALALLTEDNNASNSIVYTVPTNTKLLVLCFGWRDTTDADRVISSVSGSVDGAFTVAKSYDAGGNVGAHIYYLVNPTIGSQTFTASSAGGIGFMALGISAWSASGTPTLRETAQAKATSTAYSVPITPAQDSLLITSGVSDATGTTATEEGTQTVLYDETAGGNRPRFSSYKLVSSGATTMEWTVSNAAWLGVAAAFEDVSSGHTIVTQDIALGLSMDSTTITQNHVIQPQDISLALTADNTTITQVHVLAVQDMLLSLSTDNTTVDETAETVIQPQDIALALSTDNATIAQNHIISAQDMLLSTTIDATTLSQNHVLTAQDIALALGTDNTTLTQVHTLQTQDIGLLLRIDSTAVDDGTTQAQRSYYIDSDANVYWVINQSIGLVEKV